MKQNTKQIILDEALTFFSINGYDGVTVADIAKAVGIKASSLYKHYKNKQDIFDSIISEIELRYTSFTAQIGIEGTDPQKAVGQYIGISNDALINIGTSMFKYFLHDEYELKFRRMMTIEQYRNPAVAKLYAEKYIDSAIAFQTAIFEGLIKHNMMRNVDAKIAAMHFYSPIYISLCLCSSLPDREDMALETITQHIIQFGKLYMIGEEEHEK